MTEGSCYRQTEFEKHALGHPVDVIVACTSLHHVADLDDVLGLAAAALAPDGSLVVVEWAWERFDEPTAEWCFARLGPSVQEVEEGWLHRHRDGWASSGKPWNAYLRSWAVEEQMHAGHEIMQALQTRFATRLYADGPYFFPDLRDDVTEAVERAAVDAGQIRATGIRYVGVCRGREGARGSC